MSIVAWPRYLGLLVSLLLIVWMADAVPQPNPSPAPPTASTTPTLEEVQAKLAALATLRDLPESERTQAQGLYQQAISQLQAAKNFADSAAA